MRINKQRLFLILVFCCFVFDQLSKFFVDKVFQLHQKQVLLDGFCSIEKVYNQGAAFSILEQKTFFLILITLFVVFAVFYWVFFKTNKLSYFEVSGLACIVGGALGNLVDRLAFSHVIDFIQVEFIRFPIFNFADIFINIGVIILIVSMFVQGNGRK